ncbi:MAG: hypothetical protein A2008_06995 [Candidatus Wallbacteria bacterium GWC2_49_35]|uniref:PEGA domain-containing protein n=1 Tax=Candidatus Wallbacteria bacterium GWC2_49_35 TaxID=1817813 RepID=A0A1F7WMB8_9BACT|nr:MAG: hypothetical protein A2008_06995 [Candidatus Wallbacteria bacterium GWC2_49_35]
MRVKFFAIFLISMAFFAAGAQAAYAKSSGGFRFRLSGYVSCLKDSSPLDGVSIKLNGKKQKIKTAPSGYYEMNLTAGKYKISFSKNGYKDGGFSLESTDFEFPETEISRNAALEPVEKSLKVRGRLIDRVSGEGVRAEMRVNDEIIISGHDGYFECETFPGEVSLKVYSKAHRPYGKTFKKSNIYELDKELEIFLQRYTLFSTAEGVVMEKKNSAPVYEAVVEIAGKRVLTDDRGRFFMEINESGPQKLVCSRDGFEKVTKAIKLKAGRNKIKIYLNIKEKGLIEKLREKYEKEIIH